MTITTQFKEKYKPKVDSVEVKEDSVVEEKSIDLISAKKEDHTLAIDNISYVEGDNVSYCEGDNISFAEGALQEWNFREFGNQLIGISAGLLILFGCDLISAWAIADFTKHFESEQNESVNKTSTFFGPKCIIGIVVMSWNMGEIFGGFLGAFIIGTVSSRSIYALGSAMLFFNGFLLPCSSPFFCAKNRFMIGLIHGLIQMTLIVQAAESTTKKVRRWMLVIVTYVSALSSLSSTLLFFVYDGRFTVTYYEETEVLRIISYILMGLSLLAQLLNCFTTESMAFLLARGLETKAFQQITRLKSNHLTMFEIRYEYERIKLDAVQDKLDRKHGLCARINRIPVTSMSYIRIMALLVCNVPMTILLVTPMLNNEDNLNENVNATVNSTLSSTADFPEDIDDEFQYLSPLFILAVHQVFRLLSSFIFLLNREKYHFSRFCYKVSFGCGATLVIWFVVLMLFNSDQLVRKIFHFPALIVFVMVFMTLPIPLHIVQLCQTADSYARVKNLWSLAILILAENLFHMFLIAQMNFVIGAIFIFLINGIAMMYFSDWLLKNMPNVIAIYPITFEMLNPGKEAECDYKTHM